MTKGTTLATERGRGIMGILGRFTLRVLGWRVDGEFPPHQQLVVVFAPHTTNWDFVIALAMKYAVAVPATFMGKHTLFVWPFGVLMRAWGGIPIDRRGKHDVVAQTVDHYRRTKTVILGLAPEGTRNGGRWRSGFWHIARGAGVPILPVALDRRRKVATFGEPMMTTEDFDADVACLKRWIESACVSSRR